MPDLALLRPRDDFYVERHPRPPDILLLIEVADTSLAYDRDVKLPLYARAGIVEVWIVDLAGEAVEVHYSPTDDEGYAESVRLGANDLLEPRELPGLEVRVGEALPTR